jgi:hypothetical protein
MMDQNDPASSGQTRPTSVVKGLLGWFLRGKWRRAGRKLGDPDLSELRKTLVIVDRQLSGMPISTRLSQRRMELLKERERCRITLDAWEEKNSV